MLQAELNREQPRPCWHQPSVDKSQWHRPRWLGSWHMSWKSDINRTEQKGGGFAGSKPEKQIETETWNHWCFVCFLEKSFRIIVCFTMFHYVSLAWNRRHHRYWVHFEVPRLPGWCCEIPAAQLSELSESSGWPFVAYLKLKIICEWDVFRIYYDLLIYVKYMSNILSNYVNVPPKTMIEIWFHDFFAGLTVQFFSRQVAVPISIHTWLLATQSDWPLSATSSVCVARHGSIDVPPMHLFPAIKVTVWPEDFDWISRGFHWRFHISHQFCPLYPLSTN